MTRVLVTGMNSRQANPAASRRDVTVAHLIATGLRSAGVDVEHRTPTLQEPYDEFDHVFLGVAAVHSVGSNRAYAALAAFLRTYSSQRVTLFVDDVQLQHVANGLKVWDSHPERVFKPFYRYRLEYERALSREYRDWLMHGVSLLAKHAWPKTLVPAHPWGDVAKITRRLPQLEDPLAWDPTPLLEGSSPVSVARDSRWVSETQSAGWIERQRPRFPVTRWGRGRGFTSRPHDDRLLTEYGRAWGVLEKSPPHGWWSSRIGYAANTGAVYVTDRQAVERVDSRYWVSAEEVEEASPQVRDAFAYGQKVALGRLISSPEDTAHVLVERAR